MELKRIKAVHFCVCFWRRSNSRNKVGFTENVDAIIIFMSKAVAIFFLIICVKKEFEFLKEKAERMT